MIYQAITTRYIGPSNFRGSRVKATASAGSVTLHYDDGLSSDQNHARAALALAAKYGWHGPYVGGGLPDGRGNCYVLAPHAKEPEFEIRSDPNGDGVVLYLANRAGELCRVCRL